MPTRDANNATWFLLRHAEDFTPRPVNDPLFPLPPALDDGLFFDAARGVLELRPLPPARDAEPPPPLAVDPSGEVYRVDLLARRLLRRRCDGCEVDVVCEPGVLIDPRGMAFDRRGFLYVADARARRVVVLDPHRGRGGAEIVGILDGVLAEPVDVAVAPDGCVYVADRGGFNADGTPRAGQIAVYTPRLSRAFTFEARDSAGLPTLPRPIAVSVDGDGSVLVADARHPRLLAFAPDGTPRADVELGARVAALAGGEVALDALEQAYGRRLPRFRACVCPSACDPDDGGARLAEVQRALRFLTLALGHRFATCGAFVSRALDSGTPGTVWHRIEIAAALPVGCSVLVDTATADDPSLASFTAATAGWSDPCAGTGAPSGLPIDPAVGEILVQSPPGRFLWLRLTLASDAAADATPSVRGVRVLYPRASYLDLLPRVYRRDPEGAVFLDKFLALFERMFTRVEDRYERFSHDLNPDAAPPDVIVWLGALIDLVFDPTWSLERRRALVAAAMELYRTRGTVRGLERYLEIFTGERPVIRELFLDRPRRAAYVGRPGLVLDARFAHQFTVYVYAPDGCDAEQLRAAVDRIVEVNKPAHTIHRLRVVLPEARVGLQSTVGIDFALGAPPQQATVLGGCATPGVPAAPPGPGSVLGRDSVLGSSSPAFPRSAGPTL